MLLPASSFWHCTPENPITKRPYVFVTEKSHRSPGHLQVRKPSSMSCSHSWVQAGTSKMKVFHGFLFMVFNPIEKRKDPLKCSMQVMFFFFHLLSYAPNQPSPWQSSEATEPLECYTSGNHADVPHQRTPFSRLENPGWG